MTTPRMPTAARAALLALGACGAHAPAPQSDFGPPRAPVDPVACPAATLERFAERAAHVATITTEPVLDAARTDKLPCKPAETDAACIARARTRAVPPGYEVTSVTIGGDITHI
ncbi:MAG TPA: hypothetical protein VK427_17190, partial [Kofleriaceae bacterium]|nr:hypothetical protein [Kofleriaceae bacterium]